MSLLRVLLVVFQTKMTPIVMIDLLKMLIMFPCQQFMTALLHFAVRICFVFLKAEEIRQRIVHRFIMCMSG